MLVKNLKDLTYVGAIDESNVAELFGLVANNEKALSLAFAIVKSGKKTASHFHKFSEIYIIIKGKGKMFLGEKTKEVSEGDSILIPKDSKHSIENIGDTDLRFYCVCWPAFTPEETVMAGE